MRFYHINLESDVVDPPRFFALAYRLPVYDGVLTARVQEERDMLEKMDPTSRALSKNPGAELKDITEL